MCIQLKPPFSRHKGIGVQFTDEPTGNLDTQNSSEVIALLKEASRKYEQTIIMITHNRSIAQTADRVLQVSDGVLTDFGRVQDVWEERISTVEKGRETLHEKLS